MSTKPNRAGPDIARIGQIVLGLLWLADGALQFQPYMFGKTFVTGVILPASHGQRSVRDRAAQESGHSHRRA